MRGMHAYNNQISESRSKELFGQKTQPPSSTSTLFQYKAAEPAKAPTKELFPEKTSSTSSASTGGKRNLDDYNSDAAPSQSETSRPFSGFGNPSAASTPNLKAPATAAATKPAPTGQLSKKPVFNAAAASSVPTHLNAEGYKEFDNQDKLRALNRAFRKKLMATDVATHDIDVLLRTYVAARSAIGADLGLYQRTFAGTKRKVDEPEETVPSQYKKARSEDSQSSIAPKPTLPSASSTSDTGMSSMTPSTAPAPSDTNIFARSAQQIKPSQPVPKPLEGNKASQILDTMIPKSPAKVTSQPSATTDKPRNVFGGIQPLSTTGSSLFGSPAQPSQSSSSPSKPLFGQGNPSTTPSKPSLGFQPSTTPAKSPPKFGGFKPTGSVGGSDAFSAFAKSADSGAKKRRAELLEDEYSSSEESQAEGRKKIEEQEKAKKAKYDAIPKTGFVPSFGAAPKRSGPFETDTSGDEKADDEDTTEEVQHEADDEDQEEDSEEDGEGEDDEDDDVPTADQPDGGSETSQELSTEHIQQEIKNNPDAGKSLFDRISLPAARQDEDTPAASIEQPAIMDSNTKPGFKPSIMFGGIGKSTPEPPAASPFTSVPATQPLFKFTPASGTNDNTSVLGGAASNVPARFEGMFGSRPSTPSQDQPKPTFNTSVGPSDNTWKQGSPIKFGTTPEKSKDAPSFSFTAASPANKNGSEETPKPFAGLFGTAADTGKKPDASLGFSFGAKPAPGYLSATPHLGLGGSATSSGISSRQSSPGLTDNESVATDVTDTEAPPPDEQAKYNEGRAGEEDEDLVYEVATVKALRLTNDKTETPKDKKGSWVTMGQGPLRLLRNSEGKPRLLVRNATNGNVILNEYLQPKMGWSVQNQPGGKTGAVKGYVVTEKEGLSQWVMKLRMGLEEGLVEALETERKKLDGAGA
jgi:hypothetical protein